MVPIRIAGESAASAKASRMPPSARVPAARFNLPLEPFLDFGLHPTDSAPAQLHRRRKFALRDAEVDRTAR